MSKLGDIQDVLGKFGQLASQIPEEQQGPLLDVFKNAYANLLNSFNVKPVDTVSEDPADFAEQSLDVENSEVIENVSPSPSMVCAEQDESEDEEDEFVITPELIAQLKEIMLFVGEKLYQQGRAALDIFSRYDPMATGTISVLDFKAALRTISVYLITDELRMLLRQFGQEVESDEHDVEIAIDYRSFLKYVEAIRAKYSRSAQTASFASVMAKRAQMVASSVSEDAEERKTKKVPFKVRLVRGMKALLDHLYSRSLPLPHIFKVLSQNSGSVSKALVASQLPTYGFPDHLCTEEELTAYLHDLESAETDTLTYIEFCNFIQGSESLPAEPVALKHILADPSLVNTLVKLNSMPMRAHFKEVDEDIDGLLTVQEIINDLLVLGMSAETAQNPALGDFISTFGEKSPGKLCYAEYLRFANSRYGSLTQPPVKAPMHIAVPEETSVADLVKLVNQQIKRGISFETVFANLAEHGSSRITEADLWHALTSIGFAVSSSLTADLFHQLGPQVSGDDEDEEPTLDYHEVSLTFLHPNRNPRMSACHVDHQTAGGADNVPLGSGIDRLQHEFNDSTIGSKRKAISKAKFSHSHKFDDQDPIERTLALAAEQEKRQLGNHKATKSNVPLSGLAPGEVPESVSFGSTKRKSDGTLAASSIDFGNDHGGNIARVPTKAAMKAPKESIHISMANPVPILANNPDSRTNSDIFNAKESTGPKAKRLLRGGTAASTQSTVSFNQDDFEPYVPVKSRVAPPGGKSSIYLAHDATVTEVDMSVTGYSKRGHVHKPSDSMVLDYDEDRDTADAAKLTVGGRARKHFAPRTSIAGSGMEATESPAKGKRASRLTESSSKVDPTTYESFEDDIVAKFDAMLIGTPKKAKADPVAVPAVAVSTEVDMVVEDVEDSKANISETLEILKKEVYAQGKVKKVFSDWSKGANTMTKPQFIEGAKSVYVSLNDEIVDTLIKMADKDGKGTLTFGEFVRLLSSK